MGGWTNKQVQKLNQELSFNIKFWFKASCRCRFFIVSIYRQTSDVPLFYHFYGTNSKTERMAEIPTNSPESR